MAYAPLGTYAELHRDVDLEHLDSDGRTNHIVRLYGIAAPVGSYTGSGVPLSNEILSTKPEYYPTNPVLTSMMLPHSAREVRFASGLEDKVRLRFREGVVDPGIILAILDNYGFYAVAANKGQGLMIVYRGAPQALILVRKQSAIEVCEEVITHLIALTADQRTINEEYEMHFSVSRWGVEVQHVPQYGPALLDLVCNFPLHKGKFVGERKLMMVSPRTYRFEGKFGF